MLGRTRIVGLIVSSKQSKCVVVFARAEEGKLELGISGHSLQSNVPGSRL